MNRKIGISVLLAILILDRISKWWILEVFDLPAKRSVELLPFFNFTMVWNRGVSLGLFQMEGDTGRWIITLLTAVIAIGLAVWMWRAVERHLVIALGAIVGGAIGNIWDRIQYGAVADFIHLHAFGWSFWVFNVADSAITLGVLTLLWDSLRASSKTNT